MKNSKTFGEFPTLEQQEFQDCCERQRYNRKQFQVFSCETKNHYRIVTVMRESKEKHYKAYKERDWLGEFDQDLVDHYFGMP